MLNAITPDMTPIYGYTYINDGSQSKDGKPDSHVVPNAIELGTLAHVPSLQYRDTIQAFNDTEVEVVMCDPDTGELTFELYSIEQAN